MGTGNFIISKDSNIGFKINYASKKINQSGFLAYEYNPLKVLRYNKDVVRYEETGDIGKVTHYKEYNIESKKTIGEYIDKSTIKGIPSRNSENNYFSIGGKNYKGYIEIIEIPKNALTDLDTDKLKFSLNHPVDIIPQSSYDGSVNLILNDGVNPPKLINSRFTPTGMNTYKIVDREGSNDTNIYDDNSFITETSLYKISDSIVNLKFEGIGVGGNLKVGNYVFYFKLSDSDGNETDFVAESSIVSCHIGGIKDPFSIRGGIENENSYKTVTFFISNIDSAYDYVTVYYTRTTSSLDGAELTTAYKINNTFNVGDNSSRIYITGFETVTEVSINEINASYNLVSSANSQTVSQNMLFFGNVTKANLNYKELTDISLRFLPLLYESEGIGKVDRDYVDRTGEQYNYEYYNSFNIYNRLGYWNGEIYRIGIVYILEDYSLSPVFNVRGRYELTSDTDVKDYDNTTPLYTGNIRNYIPIDRNNHLLLNGEDNSKGVIKIKSDKFSLDSNNYESIKPIGLTFAVESGCIEILKKLGIKGFFFVRQKRIKTTFCQALPIGIEGISNLPVLKEENNYFIESFFNKSRILTHDFESRKRTVKDTVLENYGFICPEYDVNQAYFNQFFTGSDFYVEQVFDIERGNNGRDYYVMPKSQTTDPQHSTCVITAVGDSMKYVKGRSQLFCAMAGDATDASKFGTIISKEISTDRDDYIRGIFGPYLGVENNTNIKDCIANIKTPGYNPSLYKQYFEIRFRDNSPFYAISERYSIYSSSIEDSGKYKKINGIYRGDCYICNFTHRMCRNFQDSETPTNDTIIDQNTWKDNYEVDKTDSAEKRANINRGDVNAVQIGHWITTKICSNINLSYRCNDYSYTSEMGLTGNPRSFYPLSSMDTSGVSKIPESSVCNAGLSKTVSDKYNYEQALVPAIKDTFNTRILYSDIAINDAYKNGFRVFRNTNYKDYPSTYGSITKMIEWSGNIICIFEHGAAVIPINERAIAANGAGGNAFITTSNVLPENPNVLSSTFGSQWPESIIKTPYGIYGVDTVAKKIWKIAISGASFQMVVISDFKVQRFLNENITLSENELSPIIGIRNVKTHYNAFKNDIMFTFYDDINTLEEKVWNLCYNEILGKFITFYSWIPSYSENIDNIFFSFDRTASKNILCASLDSNSPTSVIISNRILDNSTPVDENLSIINSELYTKIPYAYRIGELSLKVDNSLSLDLSNVKGVGQYFELSNNCIGGYFINKIVSEKNIKYYLYLQKDTYDKLQLRKTSEIFKVPIIGRVEYDSESTTSQQEGKTSITINSILYLRFKEFDDNKEKTYFWKHGQAGLTKTDSKIKPCMWYGKRHPFEFEIVVVDNPSVHKIFTDLQIIANKTKPESLHFEISGEVYNFANDKKNMFFRQEALKNLYQYNGGNISYDSRYLDILPKQRDILGSTSIYKDKSTIFPIYYSRVDTINEIEDYYQSKLSERKDYQKMSGSEIIYDDLMNQFNIATHIKACPFGGIYYQRIPENKYNNILNNYIMGYKDDSGKMVYTKNKSEIPEEYKDSILYFEIKTYGRLNGNMDYLEDKWLIQIPSIVYRQKNEVGWTVFGENGEGPYPPLCVCNSPLPEDMESITLTQNTIPNNLKNLGYRLEPNNNSFDTTKWDTNINSTKETRLRDKYIKVRVRYSGEDLAVIYAIITSYTVSYA